MTPHNILQWNIRGLRGNFENLKIILNERNPSVTCLQETMLNSINYNAGLNYRFYGTIPELTANNRAKGGAAIIVKSNVAHDYIPLRTVLQAVAIKVVFKKQYTVCSLYLDPSTDVSYTDLEDLIGQLAPPFIILGDLNAHNSLWGSTLTNNKGRLIERLLTEHDISLLNDDSPTYYNLHNNSTSIIDLGLCSSNALLDFSWEVSRDLHGSDHFPIFLGINEPNEVESIPRWNLNKAKWSVYREECSLVADLDSTEDHIEAYDAFVDKIIAAATKAIPLTNPSKGKHLCLGGIKPAKICGK